jgi:hypothetical protein
MDAAQCTSNCALPDAPLCRRDSDDLLDILYALLLRQSSLHARKLRRCTGAWETLQRDLSAIEVWISLQ